MKKILFLLILFIFAFGERVLFDFGPNVELITTAMVLASFYFGKKESFLITFSIIVFSDLVIGNSNIFLFTWTGFLIPAILANSVLKKLTTHDSQPTTKKIFAGLNLTFTGLSANIFFYFWTNFGVWLLSNMYPKTPDGLLMSYINALPFLKNQLTSSLIFIPLSYFAIEVSLKLSERFKLASGFPQIYKSSQGSSH